MSSREPLPALSLSEKVLVHFIARGEITPRHIQDVLEAEHSDDFWSAAGGAMAAHLGAERERAAAEIDPWAADEQLAIAQASCAEFVRLCLEHPQEAARESGVMVALISSEHCETPVETMTALRAAVEAVGGGARMLLSEVLARHAHGELVGCPAEVAVELLAAASVPAGQ